MNEEEKRDMIRGVEDLSETSVKEIMIPRIDVDFISEDVSQDELLEIIAESGHSRFPIYSESIDNVIGVLYVKDLIMTFSRHETVDLAKIIRKPFFVPETKKIDTLLREFRRRHIHIAIAIDEYGGEVPSDIDELVTLPGVGRKTANVIRGNIYRIPSIVVDTHVGRLARRFGLSKNTDPEKVEYDLMKKLPKDLWILCNIQFIALGRSHCTARSPKCSECFLRDICPDRSKK